MRPKVLSADSAIALIALASTTSATATRPRAPFASTAFTTSSASARLLRTLTTTLQPAEASSSAISRPMLRPGPGDDGDAAFEFFVEGHSASFSLSACEAGIQ